jgi:hypothetical protein
MAIHHSETVKATEVHVTNETPPLYKVIGKNNSTVENAEFKKPAAKAVDGYDHGEHHFEFDNDEAIDNEQTIENDGLAREESEYTTPLEDEHNVNAMVNEEGERSHRFEESEENAFDDHHEFNVDDNDEESEHSTPLEDEPIVDAKVDEVSERSYRFEESEENAFDDHHGPNVNEESAKVDENKVRCPIC